MEELDRIVRATVMSSTWMLHIRNRMDMRTAGKRDAGDDRVTGSEPAEI